MTKIKRAVVRKDQSPMNPLRWCIQLSCGHEIWVTGKRPPKYKTAFCSKCSPNEAGDKAP